MSSVLSLSEVDQTFFVPAFELEVNGSPMPRDVVRDVIEVTYTDSLEQIDSFTFTLNNWDAEHRRNRFVGDGVKQAERDSIQPGNTVRLSMGYQGRRPDFREMMTGIITALDADFPEADSPRLTVRGLNVLDQFRSKQYTWSWPPDGGPDGIRDSEIALDLAADPDTPEGRPGLGVPVKVSKQALGKEQPRPHVFMNNKYPVIFMRELARRNGYDLFVTTDDASKPLTGDNLALWFGPTRQVSDRTYLFEWGKNLTSLRASISTTRQVKKVVVLGWDRAKKAPIRGEATLDTPGLELPAAVRSLAAANGREEVVTDYVIADEQAANAKALELLGGIAARMIEVEGVIVGLPDVRAGRVVRIERVGDQLTGNYVLTETRHVINQQGYRTSFKGRLEGPQTGAV